MAHKQAHRLDLHPQGSPGIPYVKYGLMSLALTAALALLTSCGGGSSSGPVTPVTDLKITTSTTFFPTFDPTITDYVVKTPSGALQVTVNAPAGTQVAVDGRPSASSTFTTPVTVAAGQSFPIVVNSAGSSKTYYVRCLPSDFPTWTTERPGTPQTEYYAFAPNLPVSGSGAQKHYLVIADGQGVPIWWYRSSDVPANPTPLVNGNIAWTTATTIEEHKYDGSLVHTVNVDPADTGKFDFHELQRLPNGNYILLSDVVRGPVDFSPLGGAAVGTVFDDEIEEIAPNGSLVWKWSPLAHIPVTETDQVWWASEIQPTSLGDPYHLNSVEPDGDGFVVSLRHVDGVYRINKATGNIVWKLGGTPRPESLTFVGDPFGNFGGQHDARILPDGTLTVHDNGTMKGRPPRAVRYHIDTAAKTATFIEQVTDSDVPDSICCGSARKGSGGNWVTEWGNKPMVTELTPAGAKVFRIKFTDPYFSYRAQPVPTGMLDRAALRTAMDARFPR